MLPAAMRRSSVHIPYNGVPQNSEQMREMQSAHRKSHFNFIIRYVVLFGTHSIQLVFDQYGERTRPDELPHRLADTPRGMGVHPHDIELYTAGRRRVPRSPDSQHR